MRVLQALPRVCTLIQPVELLHNPEAMSAKMKTKAKSSQVGICTQNKPRDYVGSRG